MLPLTIPLGSSPGFTRLLSVAGLIAIGSCYWLPGWWSLVAAIVVAGYLFTEWWIHLERRAGRSVILLRLHGDNNHSVELLNGESIDQLELVPGWFCYPLLVIFSLRSSEGRCLRLVIPRDALATENFRRLRVVLNGSR